MIKDPCLVADIGGTNVRFALAEPGSATISEIMSLRCADFAGPREAVQAYLEKCSLPSGTLKRAAFAVATAVTGDAIQLTNGAWSFDRKQLAHALGIDRLTVSNDFEALALALPRLTLEDFRPIGTLRPTNTLPMIAIGPGTGLGVAGVIPTRHGWVAAPGEGGHATLAAADDFESEILQAARRETGHVSAERLLSGIGLPLLLRAVCAVQGTPSIDLPAEEISHLGVTDQNPQCHTTMELFFALLGSFAGNVALTFGARGGVFIGGGIVPKLQDFLAVSRFRERFEAKGRFQPYLEKIATVTITAPYPALHGLAYALAVSDDNR